MTPPKAVPPEDGAALAGSLRLEILRNRSDFLAAARGKRVHMPAFVVQMRARADNLPPRVGFTCSKKVGNAVARNRAKRRLREVARLALAPQAQSGCDYVLIGRAKTTATRAFDEMLQDMTDALGRLHG